ncbi:MAG: pentapeptide repeat-containing protein, partial [Cyanobium sp.]
MPAATPAPMARLRQAEVLRRYQAGERDFRGADLSGLRFRGATLAGADFSGADLRGTDFLEADVQGATFVGARCGVPWLRGLLVQGGIGLLVGSAGVLLTLSVVTFWSLLFRDPYSDASHFGMLLARIIALILVAGLTVFVWEGFSAKGLSFLFLSLAVAVAVAVAILAGIAFYRSRQGAIGYAGIRAFGVVLGALGGTRFSGANLQGSFFTSTQLARVNFAPSSQRATRLERVCWKGARGLELAHARGTLLAEPRSRSLLLSGSAPGADLQGLNLRGAYLPEADLRRADLRDTNLSDAVLAGAQLEGANLKASQCLGTNLAGAHLTGATLEGWNIDHTTKLEGVDCAYVYLLEPFDAHGQRLDDHHRERLPHDPDKTFGPGDFETYFKQMIEEVKLLIKNGVDFQAFQQAYQEVMRQHPQITPESLTGIRRIGNDVLVTLQPSAPVDKGAVEQTLSAEYSLKMENARLQAQLEAERRVGEVERQRAEDHRNHAAQLVELIGRPMPPASPAAAPANVTIAPV